MDTLHIDETISSSISSNVEEISNVCILIDYDNLFHTMKRYAIDVTEDQYDVCKFLNKMYGMNKIRSFRAYADFEQVGVSLRKLQEQRVQIRNVYGNNREDKYRKNASDIELSIDGIELTYKEPNVDTYVIVTSDSDMIPIMSRLKYKGKNVHLYYTSQNTSQTVQFESFCDFSCDLLKLFKIDTKKGEPSYWFDEVENIVKEWYSDSSNSSKHYGFTWLRNDVVQTCKISEKYAGEIINTMLEVKMLISEQNGNYSSIKMPIEKVVKDNEGKVDKKEIEKVVDNQPQN